MKDWVMIHKIKSMQDNGQGSSIRAISERLKISRNTVRKYLRQKESQLAKQQQHRERTKGLDAYREYLVHVLQSYPRLSAVKVRRKLRQQAPELQVSERSLRRYLRQLKATVNVAQPRYYEPVIDCVAGVQCQVDGGELRQVLMAGIERTVYFMVFVLSYSRLMHVSVSARPIDTDGLIRMHDAAFRYFGGVPQECVYDQTKLVVIAEEFRELTLNQRFAHYAMAAGFEIRACEGYDPESKA
jgi:transposase